MKPNLRMLVATDLGVAGDLAIAAAATWARRHRGSGIVLHVARSSPPERRVLEERVRAIAPDVAARFEARIEKGAAGSRILEVAAATGVDLVVLGGRDEGHARWRFGSVAERVVTHAEVPVLVARAHAATGNVLAFTDLSEPSLVIVDAAREVARAASGRAMVIHCVEPAPASEGSSVAGVEPGAADAAVRAEAEARLRSLVADDVEVETVSGSVVPTLIAAAETHDAEVVVIASRGRTGIARFVLGSIASALVRDMDRSVLVLKRA